MRFRLIYRGPLSSNGSAKQKHEIRKALHPQLAALWQQKPLTDYPEFLTAEPELGATSLIVQVGSFTFASLVSSRIDLIAELEITFFRRQPPGVLLTHGGDLDNRIKTLLDALRMPSAAEIPAGETPAPAEVPFHCLLEDDALIYKLSVDTERLLEPGPADEVLLVIAVRTRPTRGTYDNIGLAD